MSFALPHLLYAFLIVLISCSVPAAEPMRVGFPEFKPYTYSSDGKPRGSGIEAFQKIANKLQLNYEFVAIESHGNGFTRLEKGKLDAVLVATQNQHRDALAQFSAPIGINTWSWFTQAQVGITKTQLLNNKELNVSTLLNTNTHVWLLSKDYKRVSATRDISAMLRQIDSRRIDAIFMSEGVLLHHLSLYNRKPSEFVIHQQFHQPMGIYVARHYLAKHPGFMALLNGEINKEKSTLLPSTKLDKVQ